MRTPLLLLCTLVACAVQERSSREQAITNGTVDIGDLAVVALVDADQQVGCTATVVGPHTAITAAHCFLNKPARSLRVMFGSALADGTYTAVADARTHPSFDPSMLVHDIAMLTFRDDSPASPVAFDTRTIDAALVGTSFRVVGFGSTGGATGDSGTKREGTARVSAVGAEEFTAMPNPSQPCRGDSGGPAFLGAGAIAGVVSRGDNACSDHAVYSRIDVARAVLVDPYLADTAPGTAATGDACFYAGHCAEGACLQANDEPLLWFCSKACSRDDDCPTGMACASDGCRYVEPSPGAVGSSCEQANQCASEVCREMVCTKSCNLDPSVCPPGYECKGAGASQFCLAKPDDNCGDCSTGSNAPVWLVVILWLLRRRSKGAPSCCTSGATISGSGP